MPAGGAPLVDAAEIGRLVGQSAFRRAQDLAHYGAVLETEWDAEADELVGVVQGSEPEPYRCRVRVLRGPNGRASPAAGRCSCPVADDCKHVAAVLLASNGARLRVGPAASGVRRDTAETVPDETDGWRSRVAALTTRSRPPIPSTGELGLLLELRELDGGAGRHWQSRSSHAASAPLKPQAEYRLAARPVTRSRTGSWVRGDATWATIATRRAGALDLVQQSWFAQFAALHRSTRPMYSSSEPDWVTLDDFDSELLWTLLDEAARLGIPLVAGARRGTVRVAESARLSLDASGDRAGEDPVGGDGGLRLGALLVIDDDPAPAGIHGTIGAHGVYAVALEPEPAIVLARTDEPTTAEQRALLRRPAIAVPASDVAAFVAEHLPRLRRALPVTSIDGALELPPVAPPTLVLSVAFGDGSSDQAGSMRVEACWDYDGERLPLDPAVSGELRDAAAEAAALAEVADLWPLDRASGLPEAVELKGVDAAEFTTTVLPGLEASGVLRIETTGLRPEYRELTGAPHLTITTVETEQRDWFDLGVLVTVEGRTVPFTPLFTALVKGADKLLLVDKSYLSLRHPAFDDLRRLIEEAADLDEWETGPRINRHQTALWSDFEDLADETVQARSWREAVRGLVDATDRPTVEVPAGLRAELRPYQREGFEWLAFLYRHGLGGILADDMGLGKTLQALALVAHAERGRPFLVVAPTSVVPNWLTEAARYTPGLVVRGITETDRKAASGVVDSALGADVVVTSYALLRLDAARYGSVAWAGVILDEAQVVKNPASRVHRVVAELEVPFVLALTGTPLENGLADLWALLSLTAPGLFPSRRRFAKEYIERIAQTEVPEGAAAALERLRQRVRPFLLRRTKELVAAELPEKQEQVLEVELLPAHRELYDRVLQRERQKLLGLVEDLNRHRFIVFRSLTLLRMLSLDVALIDEAHDAIASAKLDALVDRLRDVAADGHRALVFSQFTTFLHRAAARLDAAGIAHVYLDGSTRRRSAVIDSFRDGTAPVFLISLKAGGVGLNLTEADYVFLLDPWWNPAVEAQAIDRTHRIGQHRPVNVYRLVSSGTIEEKVMALRDRKAMLFDAVLDDGAFFERALSADDIRGLLEE